MTRLLLIAVFALAFFFPVDSVSASWSCTKTVLGGVSYECPYGDCDFPTFEDRCISENYICRYYPPGHEHWNSCGYGSTGWDSGDMWGNTVSGYQYDEYQCSCAWIGDACTSAPNACGQTTTGTTDQYGSCSATTPANPAGYSNACTSAPNACGQTNPGTIQCNGTCSAVTPSNGSCPSPDLTASTPGTLSGIAGSALAVSGTVSNIGSGAAAAHSSVIQICGNGSDASCTTVQTNSQRSVGALAASTAQAVSVSWTFSTAGTNGYSYRVCADNWSPTVSESNEGNNCSGWSYISITAASCTLTNNGPITSGSSATLTWNCSGGSSCSSPQFATGGASSGSVSTGALTSNQNYSVSCANRSAGNTTVIVTSSSSADISANPTRVSAGNSTNLSWSGLPACTIAGGNGFSSTALSGTNVSSGVITAQTTFTITCGTATDSVIVNVVPAIVEF